MNINELRAQMARHGDNNTELAEALGVSLSGISNRLNGKQAFTLAEVQIIIDRYNLTPAEVVLIFFTPKVAENETEVVRNGN